MAAVMAKRRRKHLGRPPLWCLVFFDHCALSGEAAAVFLALPAPPDDCGAHSVRVVEEEAHPVAVKLRALRPAMRTFPPNLHAKRRTLDRKSTRLNSSHLVISYAVFCSKKKTQPR